MKYLEIRKQIRVVRRFEDVLSIFLVKGYSTSRELCKTRQNEHGFAVHAIAA